MTVEPRPPLWRRALTYWRRVWEPRAMPIIYAGAIVAGLSIFIHPIRTIEAAVGVLVMGGWAVMLIFGGVAGLIALHRGSIGLDSTATLAVLIGWSLYAGTVWILAANLSGGNRIVQAVGITSLSALLYDRLKTLSREEVARIIETYPTADSH